MGMVHLDFSKIFDKIIYDLPLEEVERCSLGNKISPKGNLLENPCQDGRGFLHGILHVLALPHSTFLPILEIKIQNMYLLDPQRMTLSWKG